MSHALGLVNCYYYAFKIRPLYGLEVFVVKVVLLKLKPPVIKSWEIIEDAYVLLVIMVALQSKKTRTCEHWRYLGVGIRNLE